MSKDLRLATADLILCIQVRDSECVRKLLLRKLSKKFKWQTFKETIPRLLNCAFGRGPLLLMDPTAPVGRQNLVKIHVNQPLLRRFQLSKVMGSWPYDKQLRSLCPKTLRRTISNQQQWLANRGGGNWCLAPKDGKTPPTFAWLCCLHASGAVVFPGGVCFAMQGADHGAVRFAQFAGSACLATQPGGHWG